MDGVMVVTDDERGWLFWLVNEIKGCNYSRLEICQDILYLQWRCTNLF